jgi:PTS system nitrogen regulatory IIA component
VSGVKRPTAALIRLQEAVDFDSIDGENVDLVFGLMVPSELDPADRSEIESIAQFLRGESLRARLRSATTSKELYDALLAGQHQPSPKMHGAGENS